MTSILVSLPLKSLQSLKMLMALTTGGGEEVGWGCGGGGIYYSSWHCPDSYPI